MSATLAIDLGGTKVLAALVDGDQVLQRAQTPTEHDVGPDGWLEQIVDLVTPWAGRYDRLGITVTGRICDGLWYAVNPRTLAVPDAFPLFERAKDALGLEPVLANDAHAAAWGEYRFGAGRDKDMVFLTVSTGIGGGVVAGGQLLVGCSGLAGHFGQIISPFGGERFEDDAAGRWIAEQARHAGHAMDARGVFASAHAVEEVAEKGAEDWAQAIVVTSARRLGSLCQTIQMAMDPQVIVIGGGIGLAAGYLEAITAELEHLPHPFRPSLAAAALGADAGAIGIAALAKTLGSY